MELHKQSKQKNSVRSVNTGFLPQTLLLQGSKPADHSNYQRLLAQLSQHGNCIAQKRWILLIAPPVVPNSEQMKMLGIDPQKIMVLNKHQIKCDNGLVAKAVSSGNFSAVLTWLPSETVEEIQMSKGLIVEQLRQQILISSGANSEDLSRHYH